MKRNYYQIFLLLLAVAYAATTGVANSAVVTADFPGWVRFVWFGGLAAGSGVAVVAEILFTTTSLLVVERPALVFLTGLVTAYTVGFLIRGIHGIAVGHTTFGHVGYVTVALLAFAAVNMSRALQIRRYGASLAATFTALPTVEGP